MLYPSMLKMNGGGWFGNCMLFVSVYAIYALLTALLAMRFLHVGSLGPRSFPSMVGEEKKNPLEAVVALSVVVVVFLFCLLRTTSVFKHGDSK